MSPEAAAALDVLCDQLARATMARKVLLCSPDGTILAHVGESGLFTPSVSNALARLVADLLVATQLLNLVLVPVLGPAALSWSIGLGALGNAAFLLRGLLRSGAYQVQPGWGRFAGQVLLGCLVLGVALAWANQAVDWLGLRAHALQRVGWMALVLPAAAGLYLGTLGLVGVRWQQFRRRA